MKRICGACTACCTILGVGELAKPPNAPCKHACHGCAIYSSRPASCATFVCLWIQDEDSLLTKPMMRPDLSGVMFVLDADEEPGTVLLKAYEVWPGAFLEKKVRRQIRYFAKGRPVVLCTYGMEIGARAMIVGPPAQLRALAHGRT